MKKNILSILSLGLLLCTPFVSCGDDDEPVFAVSKKDYSMTPNSTSKIEGTLVEDAIWTSENEFVATATTGVINSEKVGKTTLISNGVTINVTVNPLSNLYDEPCLNWGASAENIIKQEGEPYEVEEDIISYMNDDNEAAPLTMYQFENGKLSASSVVVMSDYGQELKNFLNERYVYLDGAKEDDIEMLFYTHSFGKKDQPQIDYAVMTMNILGMYMVMYIPMTEEDLNDTMNQRTMCNTVALKEKAMDMAHRLAKLH